jgi:hypothetical protein
MTPLSGVLMEALFRAAVDVASLVDAQHDHLGGPSLIRYRTR